MCWQTVRWCVHCVYKGAVKGVLWVILVRSHLFAAPADEARNDQRVLGEQEVGHSLEAPYIQCLF